MNRGPDIPHSAAVPAAAGIGYILQCYPSLTMTFIYREVAALERKGVRVEVFSVWKPKREGLSPESRALMDGTRYVFPLSWGRFILRHLRFGLGRPVRYFGTLAALLAERGESWKNKRRTLGHFGEAVWIAEEAEQAGIRHVHAHFSHNAASITLVVSRLLGIPFSFTAHNILFTDRILLRRKVRAARFIIAISGFTGRFLTERFPEAGGKVRVVHCGLYSQDFPPPGPKPDKDRPLILSIAQMEERKGLPVLVEACRILQEQGVPFRCRIVGDGPQRLLVEDGIRRFGLGGLVESSGALFQEDVRALLRRADIFALPCLRTASGDMDGIPVVLMEAMASEAAVVSTGISGIPELVEDGRTGLLVAERDAAALAGALRRLIEDKDLRRRLGEEGRRKVLRDFNADRSADRLAAYFDEVAR